MLFNEPKLLKFEEADIQYRIIESFSALQRAEIAEIDWIVAFGVNKHTFSALQRAEIAEMPDAHTRRG